MNSCGNSRRSWRSMGRRSCPRGPTVRRIGAKSLAATRGCMANLRRRTHRFCAATTWNWRAPISILPIPSAACRTCELHQGRTHLSGGGDFSLATENFRGGLHGALELATAKQFLPANVNEQLDIYLTLHNPAVFDVHFGGNARNIPSITAAGRLALTNLLVRDQDYDSAVSDFSFTNLVLNFSHPQSLRAGGSQFITGGLL